MTDGTDLTSSLTLAQEREQALVIVDEGSYRAAATFAAECRLAARRLEERRVAEAAPLRAALKDLDAVYVPVRDAFRAIASRVEVRMSTYLESERQKAAQAQMALAAQAEAERARLQAEATAAQQAAAHAAANGDLAAAEQARAEAEVATQTAATTLPPLVAMPSRTVATPTATVTVRAPQQTWTLPGWDGRSPLALTDPQLASLVGDLAALPPGVQFLLRAGVLSAARLNALWRAGVPFPAPFLASARVRTVVRPHRTEEEAQ